MKTENKKLLLKIAREAISQKLGNFAKTKVLEKIFLEAESLSELMEERASFVTLNIHHQLRGCIGTLEAYRPLCKDVEKNACAAAFSDPRFPPLTKQEFEKVKISISVLSVPEEISFSFEADLLSQIRPKVDGLILQEGGRRGTFLPSVWDELPNKEDFFKHLKIKAGLPIGYWSSSVRVFKYTAEYIEE